MIDRTLAPYVRRSIEHWPVTLITGARQVGKSTLCKVIKDEFGFDYVSLDNPRHRDMAVKDPAMFLKLNPCPLIIDEVQYAPGLFDEIEHIVNQSKFDTGNNHGMYILTGSHVYNLMKGVTESLAGRVNIIEMSPLSSSEIGAVEERPFEVDMNYIAGRVRKVRMDPIELYERIVRGMYPELYDDPGKDTEEFYGNYIETYLQKDVSLLVNIQDKVKFSDFLSVLASLTGQELVYDTISNALGIDAKTVKSWISVLVTGHIVRLVQPYYDTHMIKRYSKHPKIYFNDTGLACYLMGITNSDVLSKGIYKGRLVETYIVNEIIKSYSNNCTKCGIFFFRDRNNHEIDLVLLKDSKLHMVECKSGVTFSEKDAKTFGYMRSESYEIAESCIICNTDEIYPIGDGVFVLPITSI